jgi:ribosomal protein L31
VTLPKNELGKPMKKFLSICIVGAAVVFPANLLGNDNLNISNEIINTQSSPQPSNCEVPKVILSQNKKLDAKKVSKKLYFSDGNNLFDKLSNSKYELGYFLISQVDILNKNVFGIDATPYKYYLEMNNNNLKGEADYFLQLSLGPQSFNSPSTNHYNIQKISVDIDGTKHNFWRGLSRTVPYCTTNNGFRTCYDVHYREFKINKAVVNYIASAPLGSLVKLEAAINDNNNLCPIYISQLATSAMLDRANQSLQKMRVKHNWNEGK